MKFNIQLKKELKRYEKNLAAERCQATAPICEPDENPQPPKTLCRPSEKVVGGVVLWKPIDKAAAMLLARAPWWALPPTSPTPPAEPPKTKKKKERIHMSNNYPSTETNRGQVVFGDKGKVQYKPTPVAFNSNGEPLFDHDDLRQMIISTIDEMPKETRPSVHAAQDARKVIDELLDGISNDMDKFRANTKTYLEDIRQTRFAVVTETAQMTRELKDVRQFFLGSDYAEQIKRLREFVDLCERLSELKKSGFLDSVADTILRLSDPVGPS